MQTRSLIAAVAFGIATLLTTNDVGHASTTRRCAIMTFDRATWVTDTLLVGTYIIEHDDLRMAHGQPCTMLYRVGSRTTRAEAVVSFHCIPHERAVSSTFRSRIMHDGTSDTDTLLEYQFAGDTEAHGVPILAVAED